ncbi:MAG: Sapep family Mn(2+)-dependent dipeptidase [Eggerthellaceae bacterium]|nr:Sapep family Mn(2+)-dependent dipeptidase [Eggerthellaceae bacterium]
MIADQHFSEEFDAHLKAYLEANWDAMMADLARLVEIPSVEDLPAAAPGAPFGPEPARALEAALALAERLGLDAHNMDGYVGYVDALCGREGAKQLGIIGHVDVVGAGPGWTVEPFAVAEREGYLLGRGVMDDKGPLLMSLFALDAVRGFLAARGEALPFDVRIIFGANEETGMADVEYYRAHEADPDFLFTPDAEFPVGYGEKGIYHAELVSEPIFAREAGIRELAGGSAVNAVPGEACAEFAAAGALAGETIHAAGKTAHASKPHEGESAIISLIQTLLADPYVARLSATERTFLAMVKRVTGAFDGSGAGVACEDDDFGPLTLVGGVIRLEPAPEAGPDAHRIIQTIDIRYPRTITEAEITAALSKAATEGAATLRVLRVEEPYLTSTDLMEVGALMDAYSYVTGDTDHGPFTMGGGTYARKFSRAASFGAEMPWVPMPEWAGGMHGADEAAPIALLQTAFKVYAHAIMNMAKPAN